MIEGAYRFSIQWQYGCISAHQDCERRTFYEGVSGACSSRKIFEIEVIAQEDFKKLRCNLVHFRKCLDSILNVYY